jgi:hypothetical protein
VPLGKEKAMQPDIDDLGYGPSSLADPLDLRRVEKVENYLSHAPAPMEFDKSYLRHLTKYHGGIPKKRWVFSAKGNDYVIERFLNFVDPKADKVRGEYNVEVTWGLILDRLNDYLVPFAELFAGNFLCFDYEEGGRPKVVVWRHEDSREDGPATEFVATNFDDFLTKLKELPTDPV